MAQTNGAAPNMEAVAAQRRDTLLALRKRKADEEAGHIQPGTNGAEITELVERCFRAFDPKTRQMRRTGIAEGVIDTAENAVSGLQSSVLAEEEIKRGEDIDLLNIAPQRPNWDLKRDLNKRLAKLARRDEEAINTLIRRRLVGQTDPAAAADNALSHLAVEGEPGNSSRRRRQQEGELPQDGDPDGPRDEPSPDSY